MQTVEEIKKIIKNTSNEEFNKNLLLNDTNWYFNQADIRCSYLQFKNSIGSVFGISAENVSLIGSGRYGRSLSPDKDFRAYHKKSDLDVIIVSEFYFEKIWDSVLSAYYAGFTHSKPMYAYSIFTKFVPFEKVKDTQTTTLRDLVTLYNEVQSRTITRYRLKNELKFRLYRNWDDVTAYHDWSLNALRKKIE